MFTDDHTLAQIAPSGLFLGTATISGAVPGQLRQPADDGAGKHQRFAATMPGDAYIRRGGLHGRRLLRRSTVNLTPGQALLQSAAATSKAATVMDDLRHTAYRMQIGARAIWATAGATTSTRSTA